MRDSLRTSFARHRFAFAILFLIPAALFVVPLIRQEVFVVRDHFDYFQPLRWFTAEELRAGRLPLWNPYSASGEPWMANPQTGVFYPPAWFFVVLPFATAYMLFLLFHLVVLGWGTYLLFTRMASRGAALVGAVALVASGPVFSLLDVSNNLATLAWIPLALWCAAAGASRWGGAALALAFLAGEPFFAALGALMYVVVGSGAAARSALPKVALTAVVAFGLSAVQLLPFLELVHGSDRAAGLDRREALRESMPLGDWLRIAVPPSLDASAIDARLGQHFIPVVYVGIPVVLLAMVGVIAARRRRAAAGWVGLLAFAVVIAAGPELLTRLPITLFRYPARLVPFAALAIAALSALGWDRIRMDKRWIDLLLALIIAADLLPRTQPLLRTGRFSTDVVPYDASIGMAAKILRVGPIDPARRAEWISGYLNLYERRFDAFTAAPVVSARYARRYEALLASPQRRELAGMGIGYILSRGAPRGFVPIARAGDVVVSRNDDALPMAAHISHTPLVMRGARWDIDTSGARAVVNTPFDGVLVLRQRAARGWRVAIDGAPAAALVVDGLFRAVSVPRGRHEIVWSYRPMSFLIGAVMTLMTLLSLQISLFVKHSR